MFRQRQTSFLHKNNGTPVVMTQANPCFTGYASDYTLFQYFGWPYLRNLWFIVPLGPLYSAMFTICPNSLCVANFEQRTKIRSRTCMRTFSINCLISQVHFFSDIHFNMKRNKLMFIKINILEIASTFSYIFISNKQFSSQIPQCCRESAQAGSGVWELQAQYTWSIFDWLQHPEFEETLKIGTKCEKIFMISLEKSPHVNSD